MLEVLGLDTDAERIYRTMLSHPQDGVEELAERLSLSDAQIRLGLDRLSELALIRRSADEHIAFRAIGPEAAMEVLLARQQAELASQQLRVEASRAAAAQLIAECSVFTRRTADVDAKQLIGPDEIRECLALLADRATTEITTFAPGGAHTEADLAASRKPNANLLSRGVQMRTVYLDSVRNHQPTLNHVDWLSAQGGQVRTTPTLPIRMVIVDQTHAVLPIDTSDARAGAVVLHGAGTVAALSALFESVWQTATPLGQTPAPDPDGLPPQERAVLRLLFQGHTDEAIAKRLGVSPRTARRVAADLMDRLNARSRFQAGARAAQQGWLPQS